MVPNLVGFFPTPAAPSTWFPSSPHGIREALKWLLTRPKPQPGSSQAQCCRGFNVHCAGKLRALVAASLHVEKQLAVQEPV